MIKRKLHEIVFASLFCLLIPASLANAASSSAEKPSPNTAEAKFERKATALAQKESEAKKLKAKADQLAKELAALLKQHSAIMHRLNEEQALLAKLTAYQSPAENAAAKVSQVDIENKEKEAKQLKSLIDQLTNELEKLRKTSRYKQQQLDEALEKIKSLKVALEIANLAKVNLEADLAKAEQAKQDAAQALFEANKELDEERKKLPEKAPTIDFSRGQAPYMQNKNITSTVVFLCRNQKIAYLDFAPLEDSADAVMKNLIQKNHQVTYSNLMNAVNAAKISSDSFALTCDGPYDYQNKTYLRFEIAQKMGNAWEDSNRLNAPDSAFRRKLASLDKTSIGIRFLVWDDSFDLYLKAVDIAKSADFYVNWQPYAADQTFGLFFPHDENTDENFDSAVWEKK